MQALEISNFPKRAGFVRATWAPVLFRPILGSPEQLIIGVVAINADGFYLERANRLDRLECLYRDQAAVAAAAVAIALDDISGDLSAGGADALASYQPLFSGVALGAAREAEGPSLDRIAISWMSAISSLYHAPVAQLPQEIEELPLRELVALVPEKKAKDRLPELVLQYLESEHPLLTKFFSPDIRNAKKRRNAPGVVIDFAGSKLVANFGTLNASQYALSVGRIKHRMWDLKVDRDKDGSVLHHRTHEMLVQHPSAMDPQITEKQSSKITDALAELEEQADQEEIRLRPMTSVAQIAQHLIASEARN